MRILIADDDPVSRRILEAKLVRWGYEVAVARDGAGAWQAIESADPPQLAILNWIMPGMDGVEVCRRARQRGKEALYTYIILLTARDREQDLVAGMEAGADDYICKPFRPDELRVRLRAGERVIEMENGRKRLIHELREALQKVKTLSGMLPICAQCKKIRDDKGYWNQLESYISEHADVFFSHCLCPACAERALAELENTAGDYA